MGVLGKKQDELPCGDLKIDALVGEKLHVALGRIGLHRLEVLHVRSMVDFFLLLMLSGAGDELQGIKKGIMELADALVITKADGDNRLRAKTAQGEYERAMHYLQPATEGWTSHAFTCSALTGEGIPEIWGVIKKFRQITQASLEQNLDSLRSDGDAAQLPLLNHTF